MRGLLLLFTQGVGLAQQDMGHQEIRPFTSEVIAVQLGQLSLHDFNSFGQSREGLFGLVQLAPCNRE